MRGSWVRVPPGLQKQNKNEMKNLLLTLAVVSLVACNSTEEGCVVIEPQDANDLPFDISSIENVNQLLDSLEAIPLDNN